MSKANTIMSECTFRLNESDTVEKAVLMMKEEGLHHLPVLSNKKLTGMISSINLLGQESTTKIGQIMSTPLIFIGEYEDLKSIVSKMLHNKIQSLPVVNNSRHLIGIVTSTDIMGHYKKISEFI